MSIEAVEANLSEAARQERRTVGATAMEGRFKSITGDSVRITGSEAVFARELVQRQGGNVVDIPIAKVDTVDHKALGRPVDKQYEASKRMVMGRLEMTGWAQAVVISCLPVLLRSDCIMEPLRKARLEAVKDGEEYTSLVFKNPHLEAAQIGPDAPKACYDYQPIQLAKEFERVYESFGGVFAFIGSPEDVLNPNWVHRAAWEEKKQKAKDWMEAMHREAQSYIDQKMPFGVRDPHRNCVRRLHHLGYLKTLPEWLEKKNDTKVEYPICPKCQLRQESPHTIQCTRPNCGWILDPRRAYELGMIDESNINLERLLRATVVEMGISDYVAETADEKPERLKLGLPKPLSKSANMLIEAQQAAQAEQLAEQGRVIGAAAANAAKGKGKAAKEEETS